MQRLLIGLIFVASLAFAQPNTELKIAVASNFASTMAEIVKRYEKYLIAHSRSAKVIQIVGSSGKHFAQIIHGAPYDLFFSADQRRPQALIERKIISSQDTFTYAIGRLVLWTATSRSHTATPLLETLKGDLKKSRPTIAIANPLLAPYGLAAQQTLQKLNLWKKIESSIIRAENINQVFHFIHSRAVLLGFIAYSQYLASTPNNRQPVQTHWLVPEYYHTPIIQQAAILHKNSLTDDFVAFFKRRQITKFIRQQGYNTQ